MVFETASPFDTPGRIAELIDWYNAATQDHDLHPLLLIGIFVVVFLEIHPFQDGNASQPILTTLLPFALRLCLCPVLIPRKRDRAKQRGLLPGTSADPGDDQVRHSGLGSLARLLPVCTTAPDDSIARKS